MLKVALLCLGILTVSLFFLCIGVLFNKRHTFRSQHIGHSKAMRDRGINCVQSMDAMMRKDNPNRVPERSER